MQLFLFTCVMYAVTKTKLMADYTITITYKQDVCPFDRKKRSIQWCKGCKAWHNPCPGIGVEHTVSQKKIGKDKMQKVIEIIK